MGLDRVDCGAGAARVLNGERVDLSRRGGAVTRLHPADLHHLAAETDEDRGADIGMGRIAPEHALEDLGAAPGRCHAAAGAVGEGGDAVDVRIGVERALAGELLGGAVDDRSRAVDRGTEGEEIARADPPVGAGVAQEGGGFDLRNRGFGRRQRGADLVAAVVVGESAVMGVDVVARGDLGGGGPDHLAEFQDRRAGRQGDAGELVPGRQRLGERAPEPERVGARLDPAREDGDCVRRVQDQSVSHDHTPAHG